MSAHQATTPRAQPIPAMVHDGMPVRLLDGDTNAVEWSGTLGEFERRNQFDDGECSAIRTALLLDGKFVTGGGASPLFVLEVNGRFSLAVFGHNSRYRVRRYEHFAHAALVAIGICTPSLSSYAAVITDLHTGEVVWQHSLPSVHGLSFRSAA